MDAKGAGSFGLPAPKRQGRVMRGKVKDRPWRCFLRGEERRDSVLVQKKEDPREDEGRRYSCLPESTEKGNDRKHLRKEGGRSLPAPRGSSSKNL